MIMIKQSLMGISRAKGALIRYGVSHYCFDYLADNGFRKRELRYDRTAPYGSLPRGLILFLEILSYHFYCIQILDYNK